MPEISPEKSDCTQNPKDATIQASCSCAQLRQVVADLQLLVNELVIQRNGDIEFWRSVFGAARQHKGIDLRTSRERRERRF